MASFRIIAALVFLQAPGIALGADQPGLAPAMETVCADPGVLGKIQARFAWAERNTWHRGFVIESIGNPRPSGHPYAEPGLVHRDYCVADAVMTNGSAHQVYYAIEHGLGFVGLGHDVDFCVPGLDPWHVHDGDCRTVR